ncbi:MAG: hypothetical protein RL173_2987 [Fibrobacterota bacterium]|jgi:rSAM/selenodomain-associated transferase 1
MNEPWILLFAKAPISGMVKTRLAAGVGPDRALEIYRALAERQMDALRRSGLPIFVWTTPPGSEADVASWLLGAKEVRLQPDGDLGARMSHACEHAFANGAPGAILVGTDCPDLDASCIAALAEIVKQGRFALQPALDGGYVAFGLPQRFPQAFETMAWSTDTVLTETVSRLRGQGIEPDLFDTLSDIDTVDDWHAWNSRHIHPTEHP